MDWSCQGQGTSGQDTPLHGLPYHCSRIVGEWGGGEWEMSGEGMSGEGVSGGG